jgi:predicted KAP-like P-loop ATPase
MATDQSKTTTLVAQVNASALSDVPTDQDQIGFRPYVRAIAWFLKSEKTKPPLTISIEGPWGSGKSSFMLQLEKELRAQAPNDRYKYVWFNGWRSDKDEALWAAFALTFITQIKGQITFCKRVAANLKLIWRRFDPRRRWFQLVLFVLSWVVLIGLIIFAALNPGLISTPQKFITDPHAFISTLARGGVVRV